MNSRYISPLTDFGFKKLFGEEANRNLLISFLNDLLPIKDKIVDINFKKNEQMAADLKNRGAVFDIFCEDEKKNQFIVEMQNARQTYFADRAVFYSTFPIQQQAEKGEWNFKLQSVYCVGLLGFELVRGENKGEEIISRDEYLHTIKLKDNRNRIFYDKLTYVFVELSKFNKNEDEIVEHFEKWIYFLKNLPNFEDVPKILRENVFEEAFKAAEIANYSSEQRLEYEKSLKKYRDRINEIETAREEGKVEGREEGRLEGREAEKMAVAEKMLSKGISEEDVAEICGLTLDEVRQITKGIKE